MSGFLDAKIAQFLPKNLTNRATISSIFIQKLNDFIYREIPPDLIRTSIRKSAILNDISGGVGLTTQKYRNLWNI